MTGFAPCFGLYFVKLVVLGSLLLASGFFFLQIDLFKTFESRANAIDPFFLTGITICEMNFLSKYGASFSM